MAEDCVINVDLADVFRQPGRKEFLHSLAWGDRVTVTARTAERLEIETDSFEEQSDGSILPVRITAFIEPTQSSQLSPDEVVIPAADNRVLKINYVDVQQGDGSVIETPQGKVLLVDGGDNQLFARYLAARFRHTSEDEPRQIDCMLVTHGDADHFQGLVEIHKSETNPEPRKRLFIAPQRVYHNGLVKRPSTVPEKQQLGATEEIDGGLIITGLVENILDVDDAEMNKPFRDWKRALETWNERQEIEFRRISFGMDEAFDFLQDEDINVSVLGPFLTEGGLKFLGKPPKGPRVGHESLEMGDEEFKGFSASHTINGHSIVFRLQYGDFNFLFSGDLNDEASRILARKHQAGEIRLRSEVFKVPHHGSADFSGAFLERVSPIISVVSSGDESARKEYIHPRATLMGALGRFSRVEEPLIFVTELVAFFSLEGWSELTDEAKREARGKFFAFSRAAYGLVKTRTDGNRLLVYTDSGKANMKEAYSYELDENDAPVPSAVIRA